MYGLIAASALLILTPVAAAAQTVEDFYRSRTVELIVGSGAGGGYDLNARLLARHLGKHIPGQPTLVVNNLPGAGGIRAANLLYNVSPRDGSVIATFSNAMITEPLLGSDASKFDPARYSWIGSITSEDGVCVAWRGSAVASWEELLQRKLVVGTAAPGTTTHTYPALLRSLFGAKFELVSGYPDGAQSALAMERGEVEAICQTLSSLQTLHPQWLRDGSVTPLVLMALKRNSDLPNLPAVSELTSDPEQQQMLKIVLAPTYAGRPFFGPPGLPADRLAALRRAFEAAMRDPALLADAAAQKLEVQPATGPEIERMVAEIYRTPDALVAKLRQTLATAN
jgi:tripartite-type tricarboxylate transporter receptor subunit TctC